MAETTSTLRRGLLYFVRGLLVVVTVAIAFAIVDMEISSYRRGADPGYLDGLSETARSMRFWLMALLKVAAGLLLAAALCATYAVWFTSGTSRRKLLLAALAAFLVFVAGVVTQQVLTYYVFLPAIAPPRPDFENMPGSLTKVGQQAPDITIKPLDREPVRLSDLRGRVILLNFFATWCGPCRFGLPDLQAIWSERQANDEFQMFVIGREESTETIRAFLEEHGFDFPAAADEDAAAFHQFAIESIPRTYLISRDGRIVYQCTGYDFQKEELHKLRDRLKTELAPPK